MGKRDSAPTFMWVATSHLNKWLAIVFLVLLFIVGTFVWGAVLHVNRTCESFTRNWTINDYSVGLVVSRDETSCETN